MFAIQAYHREIWYIEIGNLNQSITGFWGGKFYRPQATLLWTWYKNPENFFGRERCE